MPPAISIVIPAFNAETTLPDLVQDCISQTLKDVEVICVDDGSDDGTLACIEELSRQHECVRVVSIEHGGPTAARSAGADAARGEWIIFADADDPGSARKGRHHRWSELLEKKQHGFRRCRCGSKTYLVRIQWTFSFRPMYG